MRLRPMGWLLASCRTKTEAGRTSTFRTLWRRGWGQARNLAVVCTADVVIAVSGEYGTLSEIGLAKKVGRTVVSLGSWELPGHVVVGSSPDEAVEAAFGQLGV